MNDPTQPPPDNSNAGVSWVPVSARPQSRRVDLRLREYRRRLWGLLWGLSVRNGCLRLLSGSSWMTYFQYLKQGCSLVSNPAQGPRFDFKSVASADFATRAHLKKTYQAAATSQPYRWETVTVECPFSLIIVNAFAPDSARRPERMPQLIRHEVRRHFLNGSHARPLLSGIFSAGVYLSQQRISAR
jgi:hypothetical protein